MEKLIDFLNDIAVLEVNGDMDKRVYIEDSLAFMQLVLDIEEYYDIEIPDELLTDELFQSTNHLYEIISGIKDAN